MNRWGIGALVLWPIALVTLSLAILRSPELLAAELVSGFLKFCSSLAILLIFLLALVLVAVIGLLLAQAGIAAFDALGTRISSLETRIDDELNAIRRTLLKLSKRAVPQILSILSGYIAFLVSESVGADVAMKWATTLFVAVAYALASHFFAGTSSLDKAMGVLLWILPIVMFVVTIAAQDAQSPVRKLFVEPSGRDIALLSLAGLSLIALIPASLSQNTRVE